jgi:predicted RNase H-like nuclease (RuvC/YqgF family)
MSALARSLEDLMPEDDVEDAVPVVDPTFAPENEEDEEEVTGEITEEDYRELEKEVERLRKDKKRLEAQVQDLTATVSMHDEEMGNLRMHQRESGESARIFREKTQTYLSTLGTLCAQDSASKDALKRFRVGFLRIVGKGMKELFMEDTDHEQIAQRIMETGRAKAAAASVVPPMRSSRASSDGDCASGSCARDDERVRVRAPVRATAKKTQVGARVHRVDDRDDEEEERRVPVARTKSASSKGAVSRRTAHVEDDVEEDEEPAMPTRRSTQHGKGARSSRPPVDDDDRMGERAAMLLMAKESIGR